MYNVHMYVPLIQIEMYMYYVHVGIKLLIYVH